MKRNRNSKIRVWIVDDHLLFTESLKSVIESNCEYIKVEQKASNGKELLELLERKKHPNCILLDIQMPIMGGLKFLEYYKHNYPNLNILILSMHCDKLSISRALIYKAKGFVSKNISQSELIEAIKTVALGEKYIQNDYKDLFNEILTEREEINGKVLKFTAKESEFIRLCLGDCSYTEIADIMNVTYKTIDTHRYNIFKKLGVKSRNAMLIHLRERGWLEGNE